MVLEGNTNKLVWLGVTTGVVATLGLASNQLFPDAFDAGKNQIVSLVSKFTGDGADGIALHDVKSSDIDLTKSQSYGVMNLNNYVLQYGDAPDQVVDDKNRLFLHNLWNVDSGAGFGIKVDYSSTNVNSNGKLLNPNRVELADVDYQYKVKEIPGLSDVSKLSQNARIVTVGAIIDDTGNVLKVNENRDYDSIADDKNYTAILVLVDSDVNGNPRSEIVGFQFKGSDLKSKISRNEKYIFDAPVGEISSLIDGYDGSYSSHDGVFSYKDFVETGELGEFSQQDMDNYAKPLVIPYFTEGFAESADGIREALAAFAAPDKKATFDKPKGVIDVSKLDKNAAIDDLTVSKSLVVLNSKDFFKQPSSVSDSATINQNKAYFENLANTATSNKHYSSAILDGYTGEVSMPFGPGVAAVNYGDVAAISKLGPSAEIENIYAIDLDSGELLHSVMFTQNEFDDNHHYAVIVTLQQASGAGTPSDSKFELVNLYLSGADVKKEFFGDGVGTATSIAITRVVNRDNLHKNLPDNRPYEYGLISGLGFMSETNNSKPTLTRVADLKAHLRNLK